MKSVDIADGALNWRGSTALAAADRWMGAVALGNYSGVAAEFMLEQVSQCRTSNDVHDKDYHHH